MLKELSREKPTRSSTLALVKSKNVREVVAVDNRTLTTTSARFNSAVRELVVASSLILEIVLEIYSCATVFRVTRITRADFQDKVGTFSGADWELQNESMESFSVLPDE